MALHIRNHLNLGSPPLLCSIHLRQVGYYKTVAEQSKALGDGIYTLQINNHCKLCRFSSPSKSKLQVTLAEIASILSQATTQQGTFLQADSYKHFSVASNLPHAFC